MFQFIRVFVSLFIAANLLSCSNKSDQKLPTTQLAYKEGMNLSIPFNQYNLNYGYPVVFNYKNGSEVQTLLYVIRQDDPFWIDKYEYLNQETIKVDSFSVPKDVFMGDYETIENFMVNGLDSFLVRPSYAASSENLFFSFSKNHFKTHQFPSIHQGQRFSIADTKMNPINTNTTTLVGRVLYLNGKSDEYAFIDTLCKYNALVKLNLEDSSIQFFDKYDAVFCDHKISNPYIQLKLRAIINQSIITLSPFKQEFHLFKEGRMEIKTFEFEEFDEQYFNTKDPKKEMWVNDYFISLIYNQFTRKYYVLMFEGEGYSKEEPKRERQYTWLIFNDALELEGKVNFDKELSEIYTGRLLPSVNGVFLRKQIGGKYEIQEFMVD